MIYSFVISNNGYPFAFPLQRSISSCTNIKNSTHIPSTMGIETTIKTPLPKGVDPSTVTKLLHDHETYIRITCPQLISYSQVSGPRSVAPIDTPCVFEVTDRRLTGQTTFKLTLTNRADGIDSRVDGKTPTGAMVIRTRWRVRGGNGDVGCIEEEVEIESNIIVKKMVKGSIDKGHPEYHQNFLAEAAKA
ncbi:hypothetical protein F5Y04DRAFT_254594 [Hypomontagnella monticulosa]|nr:hypothetical protein F5Y04DRAFT_254594 [Hypomontagnella monticulosa]